MSKMITKAEADRMMHESLDMLLDEAQRRLLDPEFVAALAAQPSAHQRAAMMKERTDALIALVDRTREKTFAAIKEAGFEVADPNPDPDAKA